MTSTPPNLSSLTLNENYDFDGQQRTAYHFATATGIPAHQYAQQPSLPQSAIPPQTQSPLKKPVRGGLPSQWLDGAQDPRSMSPQNNSDFSSAGGSPPPIQPAQSSEDEVIPTAIVIKNIPFNVKREALLEIIASLSIPTPYAFNYHLDQQGAFRGLAFANFRQATDADAVVAALNGFDVQGRKLRVEYKKVLQAGEKERIEREKAIRRMRSMQLEKESVASPLYEEYSSPMLPQSGYSQPARSFSSSSYSAQQQQAAASYSPSSATMQSPISYSHALASGPPQAPATPSASEKANVPELDLNDPSTLEIYSRILLFKDDRMRDELAFSRTLSPKQRRVVHLIAQKLGVYHYSVGEGDERYAVVTRIDPNRRPAHTLSRAPSAYLNQSQSQTTPTATLRVKKSMPDMKTLHQQAPRLTPRTSNGNIREGYATISSPTRRTSIGFTSLFAAGNPGSFGSPGTSVPPVPQIPTGGLGSGSLNGGGNGGHESPGGVVRQPRGPGAGGFARRDSRVGMSESAASPIPIRGSDILTGEDGLPHMKWSSQT